MSTRHFVMSSEVETSLITNSFYQTVRDSSTSLRSARNDNYGITGAALANLLLTRLGFPAENARAAGKRRHILRSDASADK
jgi:hypothetical protein